MSDLEIFSSYFSCLFILPPVYFTEKIFQIFIQCSISNFPIMNCAFSVKCRNSSSNDSYRMGSK